jgi:hypothetical protein
MPNTSRLEELLDRLHQTERELQQEADRLLEQKRQQFHYQLRRGKVVFEKNVRRWHRQHRTGLWKYLLQTPLLFIVTSPLIYGMVIPLFLLDMSLTIYQQICFRVYRIPRVRRAEYLIVDRHHLAYLNIIEKINCVYCGYGNGVIEYGREITARTEQYWCPIKHAKRTLDPHHRTLFFADYGDAQSYKKLRNRLRKQWEHADKEIVEDNN